MIGVAEMGTYGPIWRFFKKCGPFSQAAGHTDSALGHIWGTPG